MHVTQMSNPMFDLLTYPLYPHVVLTVERGRCTHFNRPLLREKPPTSVRGGQTLDWENARAPIGTAREVKFVHLHRVAWLVLLVSSFAAVPGFGKLFD